MIMMKERLIIPDLEPRDLVRFWMKVKKTGGCWEWQSNKSHNGYGLFKIGKIDYRAHRVSLQLSGFILEPKMTIDHLCRNRACVNPEHMEQTTQKENTLRGISFSAKNAQKTHCPKNHKYDRINSRCRRICSICENERKKNWALKHRRISKQLKS
jgi:hypothetical protein